MCTRGVWQLHSMIISYCPTGGSSRGVREALRTTIPKFAEANPQIVFKALPKANQHPQLLGLYLDDTKRQTISLRNAQPEDVVRFASDLRNRTGRKKTHVKENKKTSNPSVQGIWEPGLSEGVAFRVTEMK